jgi:hypothetical protein
MKENFGLEIRSCPPVHHDHVVTFSEFALNSFLWSSPDQQMGTICKNFFSESFKKSMGLMSAVDLQPFSNTKKLFLS